jgi:hypothetical protein
MDDLTEINDSNVVSSFQQYCTCGEDDCKLDCRVCPMLNPDWILCLRRDNE